MEKLNLKVLTLIAVFFISCESKEEKQSRLNQEMNNKLEALGRIEKETLNQLNEAKKADSLNNGSSKEVRMNIIFLESKMRAIDEKYINIIQSKE